MKEALDLYFGNLDEYNNGLEKHFKAYAGLILAVLGLAITWWVNVIAGLVLAAFSLYVTHFMRKEALHPLSYIIDVVTILLSLWTLFG